MKDRYGHEIGYDTGWETVKVTELSEACKHELCDLIVNNLITSNQVIEKPLWNTDNPKMSGEYIVSVVDESGDNMPYKYTTSAVFFTGCNMWLKDNKFLYGVEGWTNFPKPFYKEG